MTGVAVDFSAIVSNGVVPLSRQQSYSKVLVKVLTVGGRCSTKFYINTELVDGKAKVISDYFLKRLTQMFL